MNIKTIGYVKEGKIKLEEDYVNGLKGLEGFSHIVVTWWANQLEDDQYRSHYVFEKPYKPGPDKVGVFATRSPMRPNPICISIIDVKAIDMDKGFLESYYMDMDEETPILDIKPYYSCVARIKDVSQPEWCQDLPKWYEDSGSYDWSKFFNF